MTLGCSTLQSAIGTTVGRSQVHQPHWREFRSRANHRRLAQRHRSILFARMLPDYWMVRVKSRSIQSRASVSERPENASTPCFLYGNWLPFQQRCERRFVLYAVTTVGRYSAVSITI